MTVADLITPAFILRSVDYRDSDKIITFFSRDLGKLSAIAQGARSSRKRFGGALEPFAILEISLTQTTRGGPMYRLTEATVVESHDRLATSLPHMGAAALIVELARELVQENQPDIRLFELVYETLKILSKTNESNPRTVAICAALRVLAIAGFAVGVDSCNACGRPVPKGKRVLFDIGRGGVICRACGGGPINLSANSVEFFTALACSTVEEAAGLRIKNENLTEVEEALEDFITFHLGRPLKTASFQNQITKYVQ